MSGPIRGVVKLRASPRPAGRPGAAGEGTEGRGERVGFRFEGFSPVPGTEALPVGLEDGEVPGPEGRSGPAASMRPVRLDTTCLRRGHGAGGGVSVAPGEPWAARGRAHPGWFPVRPEAWGAGLRDDE